MRATSEAAARTPSVSHEFDERAAQILNDRHSIELIKRRQFRRIKAARENIVDFFEFVMREETSRTKLKVVPHQRVMMDFIWNHPFSVIMLPPGHSKTFVSAALSLFLMGHDPSLRGVIVSATQGQAMKPLGMVKGYIEESAELRLVFPNLVPSLRPSEPWTQEKITVDRIASIRDPTLSAVGIDGAIDGSRLNFIIVDDILNEQNTATPDQRDHTFNWLQKSVVTRLDFMGENVRLIFTNTAWHPEDAAHRLRDLLKRPTLRMSVSGNIHLEGRVRGDWGVSDAIAKELRPRSEAPNDPVCRLTAHDPDPDNTQTLWPERMSRAKAEEEKANMLPEHWQQLYEQECRNDSTAMCKLEYIETGKKVAIKLGITKLLHEWHEEGALTAFTGVDLSSGEGADETALFTFYVRSEDKILVPLDIESGKWDADEIVSKIIEVQGRYNSIVRVEDNGTQKWIKQMVLNKNKTFPIVEHTTTATKKKDPVFGLRSIFVLMKNGAIAVPCDIHGQIRDHNVRKWIDACLYYKVDKHTPDILMANHLALAQAAKWGILSKNLSPTDSLSATATTIMSR